MNQQELDDIKATWQKHWVSGETAVALRGDLLNVIAEVERLRGEVNRLRDWEQKTKSINRGSGYAWLWDASTDEYEFQTVNDDNGGITVRDLVTELEIARRLLPRCADMLARTEWVGGFGGDFCPSCHREIHDSHKPDCTIAALQKDLAAQLGGSDA